MTTDALRNWAGNHAYPATVVHRPTTVAQVEDVVAASARLRALGSGHCFNDIVDAPALVVLDATPPLLEIDPGGRTVRVGAGVRYGALAAHLHAQAAVTRCTAEPVRTSTSERSSTAVSTRDASGSSRVRIRSSASTSVTRLPSCANACASSTPIAPPPSTSWPVTRSARARACSSLLTPDCSASAARSTICSCATSCAHLTRRARHTRYCAPWRYGTAGSPASTPPPDRTWDDLTTSRPHRSPAPPRASACPGRGPARPAHLGTDRVRGPRRRRRWRWRWLRRPASISGSQPTLTKSGADVRPAGRLNVDALNRRGRRCMAHPRLDLRENVHRAASPGVNGDTVSTGWAWRSIGSRAGAADVLVREVRRRGLGSLTKSPVVVLPQEDRVELTSLIDRALPGPGSALDRASQTVQAALAPALTAPAARPQVRLLHGNAKRCPPRSTRAVTAPITSSARG